MCAAAAAASVWCSRESAREREGLIRPVDIVRYTL